MALVEARARSRRALVGDHGPVQAAGALQQQPQVVLDLGVGGRQLGGLPQLRERLGMLARGFERACLRVVLSGPHELGILLRPDGRGAAQAERDERGGSQNSSLKPSWIKRGNLRRIASPVSRLVK